MTQKTMAVDTKIYDWCLRVLGLKNAVFWDVTPRGPCKNQLSFFIYLFIYFFGGQRASLASYG
jgi:hypothetical protein